MGTQLTIKLLGRFSLEKDGKPVKGLSSRKAEAMLIYLLCQKRPLSREVLADFLWDDRPQEQSLANLRSLLSGLRRHLGDFLVVSRHSIGFNLESDYQIDVDDFLHHLEPLKQHELSNFTANQIAEVETAVGLYYGAFLEGFHIRESRRFEEWVTIERERYQRLAILGWQQLIQYHLQNGNYAAGIENTVRLLETDPLNEQAHRQMMLLLAKNNQRHTALQQYDTCVRLLDDELGVPPSVETTHLFEQIRTSQITKLHNLPAQSTPFVGRESDLAELHRMVAQPNGRFITLLGPGGIGKTRLALHFAEQIVTKQPGLFLHGVRFIPLNGLENPKLLVAALANGVSFKLRGSEAPETQLVQFFGSREMLLILDSFDRLAMAQSAVSLLTSLIQKCPQLRIIVTSRVRLHLANETVFDLQGLQFPRQKTAVSIEHYAAVQLFIQNARRYLHGFQPTADDLKAILQTCRLLDGIPLGIELASAWVRFLSCQEIFEDLSQNLDIIEESGAENQQSGLHAAFDGSWELLSEPLQQTLCQISLFRGSFDRDAAKLIAKAPLPKLVRLMDSSWIRRLEQAGQARFEMLSIMRQYTAEKFRALPQLQEETRNRYIDFYTQFLADRHTLLEGQNQHQALDEIEGEIENIVFAIQLALEKQQIEPIDKSIDSLFYFYDIHSQFLSGSTLFQSMVEEVNQFPDSQSKAITLAKIESRLGWFLFHQGQYETCRQKLETSLEQLRQHDALSEAIFTLNYLGAVSRHFGDYPTAKKMLNEALTIAQDNDNLFEASIALNILGQVASLQGDYELAKAQCQEGQRLKEQVGDQWGMTHSLTYLGRVALALGELHEAHNLFEQSLALSEQFADRRGIAFAHQNLGDVALWDGAFETAVSQYDESLQRYREIADQLGVAFTQAKQGQALSLLNEPDKARRALVSSLETSLNLGSLPVMIEGILGTAVLQQISQNTAEAGQRLRYVQNSQHANQAQKERATHLLADLPAQKEDESPLTLSEYTQRIFSKESTLLIL
ncbi:MAG: tetratricopeptide repeat protein [Chloroflexota bacterium]